MPELPEVETIRRQLEPELVGRVIESLEILDQRLTRPEPPGVVSEAVRGARVSAVGRRGKYLWVGFEGGASLSIHLRMTGNLLMGGSPLGGPRLYEGPGGEDHLRAEFTLDDGSRLLFTDVRRFGHAVYFPTESDRIAYFEERLGLEPLDGSLDGPALYEMSRERRTPLKSFLLDQRGVAGIGNIYADEALHRAALHPLSPAASMKQEHCDSLALAIVDALTLGLENGGASIDDYRDLEGDRGTMQDEFLVHTREGCPCPRCEERILRTVVAGRSTYYCPACQKRLRARPRKTRGRRPAGRSV